MVRAHQHIFRKNIVSLSLYSNSSRFNLRLKHAKEHGTTKVLGIIRRSICISQCFWRQAASKSRFSVLGKNADAKSFHRRMSIYFYASCLLLDAKIEKVFLLMCALFQSGFVSRRVRTSRGNRNLESSANGNSISRI